MPLAKPRSGESRDDFVGRCISKLDDENSSLGQDQRVAACFSRWREFKGGKAPGEKMRDWKRIEFIVPINENRTVGNDFFIRGVAINETTTRNGITYIAEELDKAASSLQDKPILKDHRNSVDSIVGRTTNNIMFNTVSKSVDFEGRIMDNDIKNKIRDGRIKSVSVGAYVSDIERTKEEDGEEQGIARGIEFVELSLVAVPADPNAGFAQAIAESLKLKEESNMEILNETITTIDTTSPKALKILAEGSRNIINNQNKEEIKMSENEITQLKAELEESLKKSNEALKSEIEVLKQERIDKLRVTYEELAKERGIKVKNSDVFNAETLKTLISHLSAISIKNQDEEKKDEPDEDKKDKPEGDSEEKKEEKLKEEKAKLMDETKIIDKTKGIVGTKVDNDNQPTGYVLERSGDFMGGIGFYKKAEELGGRFKREISYPWEGGN